MEKVLPPVPAVTRLFIAVSVLILGFLKESSGQILWSSASNSAWLTGSNWTGGAVPNTTDIAQFGVNPTSGSTGVGINGNGATNN